MKKTDYNNIKQKGHLGGPSGSFNEKVFITAEQRRTRFMGFTNYFLILLIIALLN
jgi:hypothetical protein